MPNENNEPYAAASRVSAFTGAKLARICSLYFLSRLLIFAIAALSWRVLVPGQFGTLGKTWAERFMVWDAGWYLDIVRNGYSYSATEASAVGFYPLYPLLIRSAKWLGADPLIAGYVISHLALFGAVLLLWKLTELETRSSETAERAVVFLLFCPAAVWFGMVYTESLFMLTVLGCILAARRGRWIIAGACGFAAALTRTPGLLLAGFLFLEAAQQWWERRRLLALPPEAASEPATAQAMKKPFAFWLPAVAIGGPVLGHVTYLAYLQIAFGDWRAQQKTMLAGWNADGLRAPWTALLNQWNFGPPFFTGIGYPVLAVVVVLAILSLFTLRRLSYPALILALAALYVCGTSLESLPRYLCTAVPIYIVMAQLADRSRTLEVAFLTFSVALLALLTALLANGYHVI